MAAKEDKEQREKAKQDRKLKRLKQVQEAHKHSVDELFSKDMDLIRCALVAAFAPLYSRGNVKPVSDKSLSTIAEQMQTERIGASSICFQNVKDGWDANKIRKALWQVDWTVAQTHNVERFENVGTPAETALTHSYWEYNPVRQPEEQDLIHPEEVVDVDRGNLEVGKRLAFFGSTCILNTTFCVR